MRSFLLVRQRCRRARRLSVLRAVAAGWAPLGDKSLFHQWWANANRKRAGRGPHRLSVRRDCWDLGSSLTAANALLSFLGRGKSNPCAHDRADHGCEVPSRPLHKDSLGGVLVGKIMWRLASTRRGLIEARHTATLRRPTHAVFAKRWLRAVKGADRPARGSIQNDSGLPQGPAGASGAS